jgi:hypothetical protein
MVYKYSLPEGVTGLRQLGYKGFVMVQKYSGSYKVVRVNPQTSPGQAGKRTPKIKHNCSITARWYGELPSVSGLACVFAQSR